MHIKKHIITVILAAIFLLLLFPGCKGSRPELYDNVIFYKSYLDIPGVTEYDIQKVNELRRHYYYFIYGMNPGTESFVNADNEIRGFSALFCQWLTELFDIPFVPVLYEWGDLIAGLESGDIHFAGDLTETEERRKIYYMTDTIAERSVMLMRISGSVPLAEIAEFRTLRYVFLDGATTYDDVYLLVGDTFETFFVDDYSDAYELLKSGRADAFIDEGIAEAAFDIYGDVIAEDFFPIIYSPVSLTTQIPDLEPIISIVQKALQHGISRHLTILYNLGHSEYVKHKLFNNLSDAEKAYILNNPVVSFAAEYDNYPISFYNSHEAEWQGIAFDVLRQVEELTSLRFEVANDKNTEWPVLLRMLENHEASMVTELVRFEEREPHFLWPEGVIMTDYFALLSKSERRNIRANEILYTKIGLVNDTVHSALFKRWFPNHRNTVEYESVTQAFAALSRNEIDMVMSSQNQLLILTNYHELPGFKTNITFDHPYYSTFGFHKSEEILCSIIDKTLPLIDTKRITGRWVHQTYDYREKMARSRLPWLIGAAAMLLIVLILLSVLFSRKHNAGRLLENIVKKRTAEVAKQNSLMQIVNDVAAFFLESETDDQLPEMIKGMELLGKSIDVNRVSVWQNHKKEDGRLYYKVVCQWAAEGLPDLDVNTYFAYADLVPSWEGIFSRGELVNGPVDNLPMPERSVLSAFNMQSLLAVPIFLKGYFWGFVSFDDYRKKRVFPEAELQIIRSWGMLIVSAIQRHEISLKMQRTLKKLEAVTNNYKGVIWSVDRQGIITNFNGQYLTKLGILPSFLEGKKLEAARFLNDSLNIINSVEKTFANGPQEWTSGNEGKIFHSNTTLIYDSEGMASGVVGSTDDVTELYQLQRDLEEALEDAKAASQAKSIFLANMSHEIRTPMNAIIGMTSIGKTEPDSERKDYCFSKIDNASKHLLGVINDILDMSKIEANKFELSPMDFNFEKMIHSVINVVNFRVEEKNQKLTVDIDEAIPKNLIADDQRLAQVITNLVVNSVKFTSPGGMIGLHARLLEEKDGFCTIQVSVSDNGIGISPEQKSRLFRPFQQAETTTSRKFGGTGLGLSISRSIVEMMGGKIWAESELGKGSTFAFTVHAELSPEHESPAEDSEAANKKVDMKDLFAGHRILLAEDVEINREIVLALLKPTGIQIDCTENGVDTVKIIREEYDRYEMIFMDLQMPEMDGLEATRQIRAFEKELTSVSKEKPFREIPIIAMTANVFREDVEKCLEAGMNSHVGKPLNLDEVVEKLRIFLLREGNNQSK